MSGKHIRWYLAMLKHPMSRKGKMYSLLYNLSNKMAKKNKWFQEKKDSETAVDMITIACNNAKVIEWQIKFLNKNITDKFEYFVFDNSSKEDESKKIEKICDENKVGYVRLTRSRCPSALPSENHAVALNHIYKYFISKRHSKYVALLDHDIFPVAKYSVEDSLKGQPFYGYMKNESSGIQYLWPGFSLFTREVLQKNHIDFMTNWRRGGDTGSSNYPSIYQEKVKVEDYASFERISLFDTNDAQADVFSVMDHAWLHMLNGSQWKKTENALSKEAMIYDILQKLMDDKICVSDLKNISEIISDKR